VKFYNLDKVSRPFNMDACLDLLSGYKQGHASQDNWSLLYHHFVEGGHAGYVTVNARTRMIEQINPKLYQALGYRNAQDLQGKPLSNLLVQESANQLEELIKHHSPESISKPFIVTFRTQPPAYPIPMMAVVQAKRDTGSPDETLHAIFFDRKTLDEEGHRLKEILSGYQQFMELYPQLKAV
jgi:hypothetical protein